jgi:hypothetical protein
MSARKTVGRASMVRDGRRTQDEATSSSASKLMVRTLGRVSGRPTADAAAGAKSAKAEALSPSPLSSACRLEPTELALLPLLLLLAEDEREMEQKEPSAVGPAEGKGRAVGIEVADEAPRRGRAVSSCFRTGSRCQGGWISLSSYDSRVPALMMETKD